MKKSLTFLIVGCLELINPILRNSEVNEGVSFNRNFPQENNCGLIWTVEVFYNLSKFSNATTLSSQDHGRVCFVVFSWGVQLNISPFLLGCFILEVRNVFTQTFWWIYWKVYFSFFFNGILIFLSRKNAPSNILSHLQWAFNWTSLPTFWSLQNTSNMPLSSACSSQDCLDWPRQVSELDLGIPKCTGSQIWQGNHPQLW